MELYLTVMSFTLLYEVTLFTINPDVIFMGTRSVSGVVGKLNRFTHKTAFGTFIFCGLFCFLVSEISPDDFKILIEAMKLSTVICLIFKILNAITCTVCTLLARRNKERINKSSMEMFLISAEEYEKYKRYMQKISCDDENNI